MAASRRLLAASCLVATASCAAACVANPGPPPLADPDEVTSAPTTTVERRETTAPTRSQISVGVDPLRNGLNPHLISDRQAITDSIAALVLPSPFKNGELNTDLLVSAEEVTPPSASMAVQSVRYEISPAAQWSDGAPITGGDFTYLWNAMLSTPGVLEPAGYEAILQIRSSHAGKVVHVDFKEPVADWKGLFENLLPSHHAVPDGSDFSTAFYDDIPASAGRFMVNSVDRARGLITLHRNDRFWGNDPAAFDVLRLNFITSVTQGADQLRSGQVAFLDITPEETSVEALSLVPGVQARVVDRPGTLHVDFNVDSPILGSAEARGEVESFLDVPTIARQAAARRSDVLVPQIVAPSVQPADPQRIIEAIAEAGRPLRVGADPADEEAAAAARVMVDMLARYGINAEAVDVDVPSAAARRLPNGSIDAFVSRDRFDKGPLELASRYQCTPLNDGSRLANLSGLCTDYADAISHSIVSGAVTGQDAVNAVEGINELENLTVPLLGDRRVLALGEGIIGPSPDLNEWTAGLSTAAQWRLEK